MQVQVSHFHWLSTHMAAYKRPPLYKSEKGSTKNQCQVTNRIKIFSLHSVRSKSQQTQKNWRTISQTLTIFQKQFKPNQWSLCSSQRFNWSFIIDPCPLQFKHQIHRRKQQTLMRSQRRESEKKKEGIQRFWTGEEEGGDSPIYFRNSSQKSTKQNQIQEFLKIPVQVSEINTGENQNLPLSCLKTSANPNRRKSVEDSKSFGSKSTNPKKSLKTVKDSKVYNE